jgi:hypothetical protein
VRDCLQLYLEIRKANKMTPMEKEKLAYIKLYLLISD